MIEEAATLEAIAYGKKNYASYLKCIRSEDTDAAFRGFIFLVAGVLVKHLDFEFQASQHAQDIVDSITHRMTAGEPT